MRTLKISLLVFILSITIYAQENIIWEKINGPLYPATPYSFLITSNGTQFVGTDGTGLFRSTDDGQTWELKNSSIEGDRVTCLAEAPNGWIYAGSANFSNYESLARSTDNGDSWQQASLYTPQVFTITFDSAGYILVGAESGFYISTNSGSSWIKRVTGLINHNVLSILPISDSLLIVATNGGAHKSTNSGLEWIPINNGLIKWADYYRTNKLILKNDTLYVSCYNGLFYSVDLGNQWHQKSSPLRVLNLEIDDNNIFYLQQDVQKNLLRSYDSGVTWDTAFTFTDWFMYYKVINNKIYASIYSEGLFISNNSGNTFQEYFIKPYHQPEISFIKIIYDTLWLAGTYGFGVFSSNDQGVSWNKKGPLKMGASHLQVNLNNEIFVNCNENIYRSTNYGNNWEMIPPPPFFFNTRLSTISLSYSDEIFTAYHDGGITKLNNNNSWDSLAFLSTPGGSTLIVSIIFDIYNDAYLSVIHRTLSGYYYRTYQEIDNFNSFQTIFNMTSALSYNDSGYVFFANSKMYRTIDRGNTIEEINNGISSLSASTIKVISFGEIYIGDNNKLYLSTNNGDNWYTIPGPSSAGGIHSIEKVGEGYLVIASRNGIYKNTTVVSIGEVNNENLGQLKFSLSQNYPNPFNPVTKIKYSIPQSPPLGGDGRGGLVTLKVYDILGREIATLVNEEKPAGNYEVEFNAATLPSGIYFYRLKAGQYSETKKMILLK